MKVPLSSILVAWSSMVDAIDFMSLLLVTSCLDSEFQLNGEDEFGNIYKFIFISSMFIGEIIGMTTCLKYPLLILWGKRNVILGGWFLAIIFRILAAVASHDRISLIVYFCLVGFGNGCSRVVINDISADILEDEQKVFNDVISSSCSICGELYVLLIGFLCMNVYGWRTMILLASIPTILLLIFGMVYFQTDFSIWILSDGDLTGGSSNFKPNVLLRSDQERRNIIDMLVPKIWATVSWPLSTIYVLTNFAKCTGLMMLVHFYTIGVDHCNYRFNEMFSSSLTQFVGMALTFHIFFNLRVARTFIQIVLYFLAGIFAITSIPLLKRGIINVGALLFVLGLRSWLAGSHLFLGLKTIDLYPIYLRAIAITYYAILGRVGFLLALVWMFVYAQEHAMVNFSILGVCCFLASYFSSKLPFERSSGYLVRLQSTDVDLDEEEVALFTDGNRPLGNSKEVHKGTYGGAVDIGHDLDVELEGWKE